MLPGYNFQATNDKFRKEEMRNDNFSWIDLTFEDNYDTGIEYYCYIETGIRQLFVLSTFHDNRIQLLYILQISTPEVV